MDTELGVGRPERVGKKVGGSEERRILYNTYSCSDLTGSAI